MAINYYNENNIILNANRIQTNTINGEKNVSRSRIKPRLKLFVRIEDSVIDDITEVVEVHADWGGQLHTTLLNYPREILLKIASRTYIGSIHFGRKISHDSVVSDYTEVEKDGNVYRSHLSE